MECRYCQNYAHSQMRNGSDRFCGVINRMVKRTQTTCEKIEPVKVFWCDNTEHWIDVSICTARKKTLNSNCDRCLQANQILELRKMCGRILISKKSESVQTESVQPQILLKKKG